MEEIWKDVGVIKGVDFSGLYMVSNFGKVKSLNYNNTGEEGMLTPCNDGRGYLKVNLVKNRKKIGCRVHRLVAEAFIPIPEHLKDIPIEKLQVGHLKPLPDGTEDKTANEVWNIAWMSQSENQKYGTMSERKRKIQTNHKSKSKTVLQIDKNTNEVIAEFPSLNEVQRQFGYGIGNLSKCCNNEQYRHTAYGFKWKYVS